MGERLERIEQLRVGHAPEGALLAEIRGLLQDGEALLAAGAAGPSRGNGRSSVTQATPAARWG